MTAELSYAAVVRGTAALPAEAAAVPAVNAVAKLKRTNWGKGDNLVKLTKAKDDWLNKTGSLLSEAPDMSMWLYAKRVGIPLTTLHGYACPDDTKRQLLGSSAGKPALIDAGTQQFAVDVLRRRDRGNDGMNARESVDMIHDLMPELSRLQARQTFSRTICPGHSTELSRIVKAQASTTKRSAITIPQQYRWHMVHALSHLATPSHIPTAACACAGSGKSVQHAEGEESRAHPRRENLR